MNKLPKTLVYKRTHRGDPDENSRIFGVKGKDCMGQIRNWDFDAAIGVGVKHPDPDCDHKDIALKVTWVGIGKKIVGYIDRNGRRNPQLKFSTFLLRDERGADFTKIAQCLYRHMFEDGHRRALLSQNLANEEMKKEVWNILQWAEKEATKESLGKRQKIETRQIQKPSRKIVQKSHEKTRCS